MDLSPKDYDKVVEAFAAQGLSKEQAESAMQAEGYKSPGFGSKALDYGMRALDYSAGIGRGAFYGGMQALPGAPDLGVKFSDVIKGRTPPSAEMLDKLGMPEGGKVSDLYPAMYSDTGSEWLKFQKGGALDPSPRGVAGFASDVGFDPLTYLSLGTSAAAKAALKGSATASKVAKAGTFAEKYLQPVSNTLENVGKKIYKSGMSKIDQEGIKYGKEPVSDVLFDNDIWGRSSSVQKQMDTLADDLLVKRDGVLKQSDMAGAEVPMDYAMAPTKARIQQIRASKDPQLQGLADELEQQVNKYTALGARQPEPILRELPVGVNTVEPSIGGKVTPGQSEISFKTTEGSLPVGVGAVDSQMGGKYVNDALNPMNYANQKPLLKPNLEVPYSYSEAVPGMTQAEQHIPAAPQTVFDMSDRVYGPGAQQATGFKSSLGLNRANYKETGAAAAATTAEKEMQSGMRSAVEKSVGDTLGADQAKVLIDANDALGRILTTREKQAQIVIQDANRPAFSQVDASLGMLAPAALAAKQTMRAVNSGAVRTGSGLLLNKAGKHIPDSVWRQIILGGQDGR